jgi:hypothetical protein
LTRPPRSTIVTSRYIPPPGRDVGPGRERCSRGQTQGGMVLTNPAPAGGKGFEKPVVRGGNGFEKLARTGSLGFENRQRPRLRLWSARGMQRFFSIVNVAASPWRRPVS